MRRVSIILGVASASLTAAALCGCAAAGKPERSEPAPSFSAAWQQRDRIVDQPRPEYRERTTPSAPLAPVHATRDADAIAKVNGRSISRARLFDLLVRSRGAEVLEQLAAYESAAALATEKGLTISPEDVGYERRLAAERIWNPLAPFTSAPLDDAAAEQLVQTVLAEKRISTAEFDLILRRNAYLRKIVEHGETFSEAQYADEFQRAYGERVRVRHIQLATPAAVARVQERLNAGEAFETLARTHSANRASAQDGGLLEPFARNEDQLPEVFRQASFALKPGDVSGAVRAGEWYHLIRVESHIPPQRRELGGVRDTLTERLRRRLGEAAMFTLYERLLREATIEVFDPGLREAYLTRTRARGE